MAVFTGNFIISQPPQFTIFEKNIVGINLHVFKYILFLLLISIYNMYGLVLFDDGVYHCTKFSNIKRRNNEQYIAKWNSYWFEAKLLCTGSREMCLSMKKSVIFDLPYVEIVKLNSPDFPSNYNEKDLHEINNAKNSSEVDVSGNDKLKTSAHFTDTKACAGGQSEEDVNKANLGEVDNSDFFFENSDDSIADADYIPNSTSSESDTSTYCSQLVETCNKTQVDCNISQIQDRDNMTRNDSSLESTITSFVDVQEIPNTQTDCNGSQIQFGNLSRRNDTLLRCSNTSFIGFQEIPNTPVDCSNMSQIQIGNKLTRRNDTSLESKNTSFVDIQEIPNSKNKSKKYFCIYCNKLITKFARHIETVHKDHFDVKKLLLLPKGCKERHQEIAAVRKKGTYLFNTKNAYNNGQLLVTRRPQIEFNKNANDYKVCPHCKGFYSKNGIRRHYIKCKGDVVKGEKTLLSASRRVHGQVHRKADEILKNIIIPKLRDDDISRIIKYDELAIVYGNKLCTKYRKPHLQYFIRSKLRLIGRLMLELKKINKCITDFASIFEPLYYDDVVNGVNKVALLDDRLTYKSPATAFSYGTLLKKCGQILINEHIKGDNEIAQKKVKNFLYLLQEDFANSVNKTVEENQLEKKRQKKVILPSNEDVKLLNTFLNKKRHEYYVKMKTECTESNWIALAEVTLTSVQVFNRRRAGEIERLSIVDFKAHQTVDQDTDCDIFNSLTEESKKAAKQYYRCEIRGKLARNVPVLLHLSHLKAIELLIRYREDVGISKSNPYVFAVPGGDNQFLRACNLLRQFSELCGAKQPSTLRGTQLRKQIATQSVLLDLPENEITDLANFMGHAEKIHKDHYRLPIVTRDIVRMSRVLEKAQGSDYNNLNSTESELAEIELAQENKNEGTSVDGIGLDELNEYGEKGARIMDEHNVGRNKRSVSPVGTVPRRSWSSPEKREALKYFERYIERNSLPSLEYCEEVINENPVFVGRNSLQLKAWISNQIVKKKTVQTRKKRKRDATNYWSTIEKDIMRNVFGRHLQEKKIPTFPECREAIKKFSELQMRSIQTVKAWVNNEIRKTMKTTQRLS